MIFRCDLESDLDVTLVDLGNDFELGWWPWTSPIPIKSPPCNFEFVQVCRCIIHYIKTYFPLWISFVEHMQHPPVKCRNCLAGTKITPEWGTHLYVYTIDIEVYTLQNYILFQRAFYANRSTPIFLYYQDNIFNNLQPSCM